MRLQITSAVEDEGGGVDDDGPELLGSVEAVVAAGAATFNPGPVVKWDRLLRQEGNAAIVDATLHVGNRECFSDAPPACWARWGRRRGGGEPTRRARYGSHSPNRMDCH